MREREREREGAAHQLAGAERNIDCRRVGTLPLTAAPHAARRPSRVRQSADSCYPTHSWSDARCHAVVAQPPHCRPRPPAALLSLFLSLPPFLPLTIYLCLLLSDSSRWTSLPFSFLSPVQIIWLWPFEAQCILGSLKGKRWKVERKQRMKRRMNKFTVMNKSNWSGRDPKIRECVSTDRNWRN